MDEIAEVIDKLENIIAAMTLPMPPEIHFSILKESLPDTVQMLKQAYLNAGGENYWVEQ